MKYLKLKPYLKSSHIPSGPKETNKVIREKKNTTKMYGYIPAGAIKNNFKKKTDQKKTNYIPGEPKETIKVILKKKHTENILFHTNRT